MVDRCGSYWLRGKKINPISARVLLCLNRNNLHFSAWETSMNFLIRQKAFYSQKHWHTRLWLEILPRNRKMKIGNSWLVTMLEDHFTFLEKKIFRIPWHIWRREESHCSVPLSQFALFRKKKEGGTFINVLKDWAIFKWYILTVLIIWFVFFSAWCTVRGKLKWLLLVVGHRKKLKWQWEIAFVMKGSINKSFAHVYPF